MTGKECQVSLSSRLGGSAWAWELGEVHKRNLVVSTGPMSDYEAPGTEEGFF